VKIEGLSSEKKRYRISIATIHTMSLQKKQKVTMRFLHKVVQSMIIFSIGFYIRGIVDFYFLHTTFDHVDLAVNLKPAQVQGQVEHQAIPNMQVSTGTHTTNNHSNQTHWCIIASKFLPRTTNSHFDHFPHSSEIILPCWSYFIKQNVTNNCGFYLAGERFVLPKWTKEVVEKMGCKVKMQTQGVPKDNIIESIPVDDVQYIPNLYLLRPRFDYFHYLDHPEHATILRKRFVSDDTIANAKGNDKPLQIGIIQRPNARRIDNLIEIEKGLQRNIPNGNITITNFTFSTVEEQATWFATKDMIIAAHGAALTNSIFVTPGTIVLVMYPPGYFLQTLEPLIEQSGGIAIQWYEKGINPYVKSYLIEKENHTAYEALGQYGGFSPPVKEVVSRVKLALGLKLATVSAMYGVHGGYH